MDTIEAINRYLSNAMREQSGGSTAPGRSRAPFITISRESGAGGHRLAEAILEEFESHSDDPRFAGWKVFDRKLCELVADDPDLHVSLRALHDETSLNAVEGLVSMMLGKSPQRDIHRKVAETIRELALVGKAIIVGRGGECVTRDLTTGLHLRLVAPFDLRVERETGSRGEQVDDVAKWVREQDRNRASFVKRVYGHAVDDPLLYDAVWNTERIPLEVVVGSAVDWLERRPS